MKDKVDACPVVIDAPNHFKSMSLFLCMHLYGVDTMKTPQLHKPQLKTTVPRGSWPRASSSVRKVTTWATKTWTNCGSLFAC